jgi:S1-C subfamily serine protease
MAATPGVSTAPRTLTPAELAARAGPAVVRFDVAPCAGESWMGSGFVVGEHLVMTAAHMVDGAATITIEADNTVTSATVVAIDRDNDAALVRTSVAIEARPLELETTAPVLGESLTVLGFPLQTFERHLTEGVLSALDQPVDYGTPTNHGHIEVQHALVTDSAINGGNSGGPAIADDGRVVGLVSGVATYTGSEPVNGQGFLSPSHVLAADLRSWRNMSSEPPPRCAHDGDGYGTETDLSVHVDTDDPLSADMAQTLATFASSINTGRYDAAWAMYSPNLKRALGGRVAPWAAGLTSSYWTTIDVERAASHGDRATTDVRFTTLQAPADGPDHQSCSDWLVRYTMVRSGSAWLIDSSKRLAEPADCS